MKRQLTILVSIGLAAFFVMLVTVSASGVNQTSASSLIKSDDRFFQEWITKGNLSAANLESQDAETQITYGLLYEPDNLNPYIAPWNTTRKVNSFMLEGLIGTNPSGELYPILATSLPTLANGSVSPDGLTITYTLRTDVNWSDGEPFTCDDILFTYEAVTHPDSGAVGVDHYDQISSVTCSGDFTVILHFNSKYLEYYSLFDTILPRHAAGDPASMETWDYNTHPIGTGPFRLVSWDVGEQIILEKNPDYRSYPDKPLMDEITIFYLSSKEEGKELINSGAIDILGDLSTGDVLEYIDDPSINIHRQSNRSVERLLLNLADPTLDATDDPLNNPHWALGQKEVRQAIQYGIDKQAIDDQEFGGLVDIGTTELSVAVMNCSIPQSEYITATANTLLTNAGWTDLDMDGVRECNGCPYADPGRPLTMTIQSTLGNESRLAVENMLVDMMDEIGIELNIENVSSSELFGSWEFGAFRKHGDFDILMYTTSGGGMNDHDHIYNHFHSSMMPTYDNGGDGSNYVRWDNSDADTALDLAGTSLDLSARNAAYQTACEQIAEDIPHLYLYERQEIYLVRDNIEGFQINSLFNRTWNEENWDRSCCETSVVITPEVGGALTSTVNLTTTLTFPPGAVSEPVTITHDITATHTISSGFKFVGQNFSITAVTADGTPVTSFTEPFTLTIHYSDADIFGVDEESLVLSYWNTETGSWEVILATLDVGTNTITAVLDHLTDFAVIGESQSLIFLPTLFQN